MQFTLYNPSLSVEANARILGCSVAAIKKHLAKQSIDRNFDAQYVKWKNVSDYFRQHPDSSLRQCRSDIGLSVNTIRKYKAISEDDLIVSKRDTEKVSCFDIRNSNCIRSVSKSQDEILGWIMRLYNNNQPFDADLTYSKGNFYKKVSEPKCKYDLYPQVEGVMPLSDADTLPDESFSSIVYDLPFIISDDSNSLLKDRFTYFTSSDKLYEANRQMIERSYRLLKEGGLLIVKTMDVAYGGKQFWVSDYVLEIAKHKGLELLDKFILTYHHRLFSKTHQQHIARKYHSYFFILKKR